MKTIKQKSRYSDIKHTLTEFTIAVEALRQRKLLELALEALGRGKPEQAKTILAELERKEP